MVGKIGKITILLCMTFLLNACSIFADKEQKENTMQQKNHKNVQPKVVQQETLKLNPKSVVTKDKPKNKKFPKEIIPLVQTLVADDQQLQHSAIAPELNNSFPKGRLFPKGTVIHLDTKDWRQQDYLPAKSIGNIVGKISMPKKPVQSILITFIYKQQQWKVTFMQISASSTMELAQGKT